MFRLSTCLLLGSAEALGSDETSLMQGLKPVQDLKQRRHDKSAVSSLLESAKGMLKNGETSEVTAFAQRALDEIRNGVLPAIEDASLQDQALLNAHWGLFQRALDGLEEGLEELRALQEGHETATQHHTQCRSLESQACSAKVDCDYELFDLWRDFATEERLLRTYARAFDGHFCPGNGTDPEFRRRNPLLMNTWKDQKVVVDRVHGYYDPKRLECEEFFAALDQKSATCNAGKTNLEEVACDHASLAIRVRSQFTCDWQHAIDTYDRTEKEARVLQVDRVREWRTLTMVDCLLSQTTLRNGRPCEEDGEFNGIYARCEREHEPFGTGNSWLIHFPCEERQCSDGSVGIGPHLNDDGSLNAGCGGPLTCPSVSPNCEYRTYATFHPAVAYSHCELGTCLGPDSTSSDSTGKCSGGCQANLDYKTTCVPVDVHAPCSTQFDEQEYGQIFDFIPQPEFYWRSNEPVASGGDKNTHCNQPEPCQVCELPVVQQCTLTNTLAPVTLPPTTLPPQEPLPICPPRWVQVGEHGADISGCGLQACDQRYETLSEMECAESCDAMAGCEGFNWSPERGDKNHESSTVCTLYGSSAPTGTWYGSAGYVQVFCTRAQTTEPPAPQCGDLPELTNAEWVPSIPGQLMYSCNPGYSFNGMASLAEILEIQCLSNGRYSQVRVCLPIDDCLGHTCGAFGVCVDSHMDYSCECAPGYEQDEVDGEKVCGNEDDCHRSSCGSGGLCVDLVQDYSCDCHEGWHEMATPDGGKTCSRIECGQVPQVDNVASSGQQGTNYPWSRGKAAFGDTIEYDCMSGFTTDGEHDGAIGFSIVCQADGTFTATQQCVPVSCGTPEASGNAVPDSVEALHFGQEVQYSCPEGTGPDTWVRRCQANGQLSPALACEPKLCPGVPVFPMAQVTSENPLYFFGQTAEFSCEAGYSTDPTDPSAVAFSVGCLAHGWETGIGGCHPVTCEFQPDETHHDDEPMTLHYGSFGPSNLVRCAADHTVSGAADGMKTHLATCGANGEHDIPSCHMIVCPASNLMIALYATVHEPADHRVGSRATYACDDGYSVAGSLATSFEVECRSNGQFSAMSTCRNIDDCVGHTCGSNGRCVDGINAFSCICEDGFEETTNEGGERICGNIDDCGPRACGAHGVCHDQTNGYECVCDEGFLVQNAETSDRICEAHICSLAGLENVESTPESISFPESLFINCSHGYSAHGFAAGEQTFFQVECGADGELKAGSFHGGAAEIPVCQPVSCGQFPTVEFAQDMPTQGVEHEFIFGEVAIFGCQGGEVELRYECQADGQYEIVSDFKTCQNECGEPSIPLRAHRLDGAGVVTHPNVARWACDEGFTHGSEQGEEVSQGCAANGVFEALGFDMTRDADGNLACLPVQCERPVAPQNWEWTADASDFNFLNPTFLRCAEGYEFHGASGAASQEEVRCEATGAHSALPNACELITFRLFGRIRSALTTNAISGATLEVSGASHVSDGNGGYEIVLAPGTYECIIRADGFITNHVTVQLLDDAPFDLYLSPVLEADAWRIVLTWNANPEDLDSHLVFHGDEGSCPEMFWNNRRATCGGVVANLDVDDTNGNGPETTTLSDLSRCGRGFNWRRTCERWVFRVRHYTALYEQYYGWPNTHGWSLSGATVTLYNGDHTHGVYDVSDAACPTCNDFGGNGAGGFTNDEGLGGGENKYWSVFAITSGGTVDTCSNENCD